MSMGPQIWHAVCNTRSQLTHSKPVEKEMAMRKQLERMKVRIAGTLGRLAWIAAGGILALAVGLGQLQAGQAAQGARSLLVGSILLVLVRASQPQHLN